MHREQLVHLLLEAIEFFLIGLFLFLQSFVGLLCICNGLIAAELYE